MLENIGRWLGLGWLWNVLAYFRKGDLPSHRAGMFCPYYGKCKGKTCSYAVAINKDNTVVNSAKWTSRSKIAHPIWATRMDCSAGRDGR